MSDDLPSAALRVAAHARHASEPTCVVLSDDLRALLPLLDAVAAGRGDAGRVERWARPIFAVLAEAEGAQSTFDDCLQVRKDGREGEYPHRMRWFRTVMAQARAAIALADAERAAG